MAICFLARMPSSTCNCRGDAGSVTLPSNALLFPPRVCVWAWLSRWRVVLTPVVFGRDYGDAVEVTSGLTPQDAVILDPPDSLERG